MNASLLKARSLVKRYGGFAAVDGFELDVVPGEIHSIIGPNGAGKSTVFNLITGLAKANAGSIEFAGRDITGHAPHDIARSGIICGFQVPSVLPRLTVLESVVFGILARRRRYSQLWFLHRRRLEVEARGILEEVGLDTQRDVESRHLSHGDQRTLEIAMALSCDPKLLMLDEPTAGMSSFETQRITRLLQQVSRERQLSILLIEHDMQVVFGISDRVTVMHMGANFALGSPAEISAKEEVRAIYLGGGG